MRTYIIVLVVLLMGMSIGAQTLGQQLQEKLKDVDRLDRIMSVVDSFYRELPSEISQNGGDDLPKLKHWKRWEWQKGKELGSDGEFVNSTAMVLLADAQQKRNNKSSANRSNTQLPGAWENIGIRESIYSADTLNNSYANGVGRVDRIAFHPTDPDIFYVGTPYGGLWKTEDGGTTWDCKTDTIPAIGISAIIVDWATPNNIYILTGTGDNTANGFVATFEYNNPSAGVMKSTDGGNTWSPTGDLPTTAGINSYFGYDMVQNPVYPLEILAATSDGIFFTNNGGTSWSKVKDGFHFDLEFKPNDPNVVYCTTNDTIYYSTTYGTSWQASTVNIAIPTTNNRIALGVTNAKTGNVYAFCGSALGTGIFQGIYKSTNSGVSFTQIVNTPNVLGYLDNGQDNRSQGAYDLCIAISPVDTNIISAASINVWGSTNGGTSFTSRSKWNENISSNAQYVHPDHHSIVYNPLNNRLYSTNDGGVYYSDDNSTTWTNITKGLIVSQFYHLTQNRDLPHHLAGGLQDNGIKARYYGGDDMEHIHGADGFSTAFDPTNPNVLYITLNDIYKKINLITGQTISSNNPSNQFFKHLLTHPTDPNIVYMGSQPMRRSTNGGTSWSSVSANGRWSLAQSPSNPQQMYAAGGAQIGAGNGTISRSSDGGINWTTLSTGSNGFPAIINMRITDIAINPADSLKLSITVGGFTAGSKIYFSNNGGNSFSNISFDLPNVVAHSVAMTTTHTYVGTDLGIYSKLNGTANWVSIRDNMPKIPVTDIYVDENTGTFTCSTFGRGIWQRKYCVDQITLSGSLQGFLEFESTNLITATVLIPGNEMDSIFMQSGKLQFLPGFHAKKGTFMKASLGTCDNGPQPLVGVKDGQEEVSKESKVRMD